MGRRLKPESACQWLFSQSFLSENRHLCLVIYLHRLLPPFLFISFPSFYLWLGLYQIIVRTCHTSPAGRCTMHPARSIMTVFQVFSPPILLQQFHRAPHTTILIHTPWYLQHLSLLTLLTSINLRLHVIATRVLLPSDPCQCPSLMTQHSLLILASIPISRSLTLHSTRSSHPNPLL